MVKSKLLIALLLAVTSLSACRTQKEIKAVTSESTATVAVSSMAVTAQSSESKSRDFSFSFDSLEVVVERSWPTSMADSCAPVISASPSCQRITLRAFGGKVDNAEIGNVSKNVDVVKSDSVATNSNSQSNLQSSQDTKVIYDPPNANLAIIIASIVFCVLIVFIIWMKRRLKG